MSGKMHGGTSTSSAWSKASEYVLALDIGTTSLKGVLFDTRGYAVASRAQEYDLIGTTPGIVELDCQVYWESALIVIRGVMEQSGIHAGEIKAVGVTSQGETLTVLDRNGKPLRRSIVWLDSRSQEEAAAIAERFGLDAVYRITGQQEVIPTWSATRILWIRKHQPEVFARADKYLLVEDYLLYRLTGSFVTDHALNPSTLYYDIIARDWWDDMLKFLGVRRDQLPRLNDSGAVVGTIGEDAAKATGLSRKTVVTTAPIDQVAGAVGAGNIEAGIITETTGAALAICATVDRPVYDPAKRLGLYSHASRNQFALLPWVPTAGMVLRWFRDEFGGGADYSALVKEAAAVAPGADGLVVLPHLNGAGCPEFNPKAKGVFWGVTLSHRRGHFVRAILESVAFMLRCNLELLAELGIDIREVRSLGGAAKSALWLQIKADVCHKDLLIMECEEATCLGVAMLSCVGCGIYGNLAEARKRMVRVGKKVRYRPAAAAEYDAAYRRYLDLNRKVKGLF